jgi:hypothetical protein
MQNFSALWWRVQVNVQWDDDEVRFVLKQHAELDFYSASSLKQQSANRHVIPLRHIILIPSQPVFALSPNHRDGRMVSVLASSEEGRGFESRSDQIKDYPIGICCFSAKHAGYHSFYDMRTSEYPEKIIDPSHWQDCIALSVVSRLRTVIELTTRHILQ